MLEFLGGPICWGDLYREDNWGDLKVWGDLILLGGPKTPLYTMKNASTGNIGWLNMTFVRYFL